MFKFPSFFSNPKSHFRGAKESHPTPEPQGADPWPIETTRELKHAEKAMHTFYCCVTCFAHIHGPCHRDRSKTQEYRIPQSLHITGQVLLGTRTQYWRGTNIKT